MMMLAHDICGRLFRGGAMFPPCDVGALILDGIALPGTRFRANGRVWRVGLLGTNRMLYCGDEILVPTEPNENGTKQVRLLPLDKYAELQGAQL